MTSVINVKDKGRGCKITWKEKSDMGSVHTQISLFREGLNTNTDHLKNHQSIQPIRQQF